MKSKYRILKITNRDGVDWYYPQYKFCGLWLTFIDDRSGFLYKDHAEDHLNNHIKRANRRVMKKVIKEFDSKGEILTND